MIFKVHPKEKIYFKCMLAISLVCYAFLFMQMTLIPALIFYGLLIAGYKFLTSIWLVGYLSGNAIKVDADQMPEIFHAVKKQSQQLELEEVPMVYILQSGGMLNAFAARLAGKNYVVLYSDIVATAYQEGMAEVEFILGHELGHIKRGHVSGLKSLLILPAKLIPFLGSAYSRACEYTCDLIGHSLCSAGALKGILILAAGPGLYKKVNIKAALAAPAQESTFALWFAEIFATHPHLVNRLAHLNELGHEHMATHEWSAYSAKVDQTRESFPAMREPLNEQAKLKSDEMQFGGIKRHDQYNTRP